MRVGEWRDVRGGHGLYQRYKEIKSHTGELGVWLNVAVSSMSAAMVAKSLTNDYELATTS